MCQVEGSFSPNEDNDVKDDLISDVELGEIEEFYCKCSIGQDG
jgi:hypothetical protein